MSDARWLDVDDDLASAARHFTMAVRLHSKGGFDGDDLNAYRASMALQHALQSGHTAAEAALLRILQIIGEEAPTGGDWHNALIRRLSRERHDDSPRPALLNRDVATDLDETRRFRHRAMHAYDGFDPRLAEPAVAAASRLAATLDRAVEAFREAIDG